MFLLTPHFMKPGTFYKLAPFQIEVFLIKMQSKNSRHKMTPLSFQDLTNFSHKEERKKERVEKVTEINKNEAFEHTHIICHTWVSTSS